MNIKHERIRYLWPCRTLFRCSSYFCCILAFIHFDGIFLGRSYLLDSTPSGRQLLSNYKIKNNTLPARSYLPSSLNEGLITKRSSPTATIAKCCASGDDRPFPFSAAPQRTVTLVEVVDPTTVHNEVNWVVVTLITVLKDTFTVCNHLQ